MIRVTAEVAILAGSLLVAVASIGLHRFDDVFARLHAAGKATSLAFLLVSIGAFAHGLPARAAGELVLASVVLLVTTPVGVHVLADAAYRCGDQLSSSTTIDELADRSAPSADLDE